MGCSTRRELLQMIGSAAFCALAGRSWLSAQGVGEERVGKSGAPEQELIVEQWMDEWMNSRQVLGTLTVSRFVEPIYYLKAPISWRPGRGQGVFKPVNVPVGFVTDFASIPRPFWSLLPPEGEYAYAAILHDFLYWTQDRPRAAADNILKLAIEEFGISAATVLVIYRAVRLGGGASWRDNAALKKKGERRILKIFPNDPKIRWRDWKRNPGVFE
jgi:Protein of unknown function (DUF1353)